ncbi:MAG: InlB B-repeat-containing protein, partial [Spirochaetota bacterium]
TENSFTFTTTTTYALTYDKNDTSNTPVISGTLPVDSSAYAEGESAIVYGNTGNLVITSYSFAGWNTQSDGNGTAYAPGSRLIFSTADVTLYAVWKLKPYQVTYNLNGGTGDVTESVHYDTGDTVTVTPSIPGRTNYTFKGWSTVLNGSVAYTANSTFTINSNTTLYAVWEKKLVTEIALSTITSDSYFVVGFNPVTLTATVSPDDAFEKSVTWNSSDSTIASVSANGEVSFKAAGTAIITATANDGTGVKGTRQITVQPSYPVSNAADLEIVRNNLGGHFIISVSSVNMGEVGWIPIGTTDKPFTGNFDGNGGRISTLSIPSGGAGRVGFFGEIGENGIVKNLAIMALSPIGSANQTYVGLLAGVNKGTIENCSTSGPVQGSKCIGGLVGFNQGTITSCSSSSNVTGLKNSDDEIVYIGGLVGFSLTGKIERSFATGIVDGAGGISCGGLVGYNNSISIVNCYATGSVKGSYGSYQWVDHGTGGLVGTNQSFIENCYATGTVTNGGTTQTDTEYFGGLVGYNKLGSGYTDNSYYNKDTTGMADTGKGVGKTNIEMLDKNMYSGWNFIEIWLSPVNTGGTDDKYPLLR